MIYYSYSKLVLTFMENLQLTASGEKVCSEMEATVSSETLVQIYQAV